MLAWEIRQPALPNPWSAGIRSRPAPSEPSQTRPRKPLSADSHIAEIEACYAEIDPRYRDQRPVASYDPKRGGALFHVPNFELTQSVPMGLVCTAGRAPEQFGTPIDWDELHPGGFDGKKRLEMQASRASCFPAPPPSTTMTTRATTRSGKLAPGSGSPCRSIS